MEFRTSETAKLEKWFCPVYNHKIDSGLCFEVSNIGDDTLCLKGNDKPPCNWAEAHKICLDCPRYVDWD